MRQGLRRGGIVGVQKDPPGRQPVDGRADASLDLVALLVTQCHVIRPFRLPCRSLRGSAWTARARPATGSSPLGDARAGQQDGAGSRAGGHLPLLELPIRLGSPLEFLLRFRLPPFVVEDGPGAAGPA
ncbi:hypothetical protein ACFY3N_20100 [Streptomyces sp. NPDC000348]|uniref:hypothetical protein n=1 Tax=Streptomyces sp. NPDC000348 TaxID=3364538 RepID=UPI003680B5F9